MNDTVKGRLRKSQEILKQRLINRRNHLDLTYQELSDRTGISKSALQRYETGEIRSLAFDKIFILADALEVPVSYFINFEDDYSTDYSTPIETSAEDKLDRIDTNKTSYINNESNNHNYIANRDNISNNVIDERIKRREYFEAAVSFEREAISTITPILFSLGYNVEQKNNYLGDIVATKGKEIWHFHFLYVSDKDTSSINFIRRKSLLFQRFGRLALYTKPITKYSIVVDSNDVAKSLISDKPVNISIKTSVIATYGIYDGFKEFFYEDEIESKYYSLKSNNY